MRALSARDWNPKEPMLPETLADTARRWRVCPTGRATSGFGFWSRLGRVAEAADAARRRMSVLDAVGRVLDAAAGLDARGRNRAVM